MRQVGFIGVGTMGLPMARNLLRKGYGVVAYDVNAAALDEIARDGAVKAESPRNVAERVDVVITMLPSSPHVERVILGSDGVLEGCRPGGTIIDMSTIDPITTKKVAAAAAERGVRFLDAPVSGSTQGARDGTLTIMVGGPAEVLNEHYPILEAMGRNIIHVGDVGMGEMAKLATQLVVGASMIAVAEAFALGMRAGLDPKTLFQVINKSSGNCWALEKRVPVPGIVPDNPANEDFAPGFMVDLMHKDLGLVLDTARALKVPTMLAALAQQYYAAAQAHGLGKKDFAAVSRVVNTLAAST